MTTRAQTRARERSIRPREGSAGHVVREETGGILAVVMPVYNEEDCLWATVEEVQREILDFVPGASLLAIDDGSTDGSGGLLDDLARSDRRVHVLHERNRGHGGALLAGIAAAKSEYVFLIDSDRQIPLDHFSLLWAAVQSGRRAAVGVRRTRRDAPTRIALTVLIRRVIRMLFGVYVHDANIPFKLVRRADWLAARPLIPEGTLAPSLLLGVFFKLEGFDVAEVEVIHRNRTTGQISVRGLGMASFCARAFVQLLRFRKRYRSRSRSRKLTT